LLTCVACIHLHSSYACLICVWGGFG